MSESSHDNVGSDSSSRVILCFGDSNTWGYEPGTGRRLPPLRRWPEVLQVELGSKYRVVSDGLNGRTTVHDDPAVPYRNGLRALPFVLMAQRPIDLLIIMLGTNDLKKRFGLSPFEIAQGASWLVELARQLPCGPESGELSVMLTVPPPMRPSNAFEDQFAGAYKKQSRLAEEFYKVGHALGCEIIDFSLEFPASSADGIHWGTEQHCGFAKRMSERVLAGAR